jgi:hypothetical protein
MLFFDMLLARRMFFVYPVPFCTGEMFDAIWMVLRAAGRGVVEGFGV